MSEAEGADKLRVIIVSDGTGETASSVAQAALTQFTDKEVFFVRHKNIRTKEQIDAILTEASIHNDLVVYTVVSNELREFASELSKIKKIKSVDLMGPILNSFAQAFGKNPSFQPGLLHAVNKKYFEKVDAIEFTLNNDDGRNVESMNEADVVLVGVSRTSKTPLSIYLSLHGLKVVNIPLVYGTEVPPALFQIDQRKIFGLTIEADALREIRKNRLTRLGAHKHDGDYADMNNVIKEIEWANGIFKENKRWPIHNVTNKALEEVAAEILKLVNMRKNNQFKQSKYNE